METENSQADENLLKEEVERNSSVDAEILTPQGDVLAAALTPLVEPIYGKLDNLNRLFEAKLQDDATKAELFDKLYDDLTRYRDDFIFKHITGEIFADLIRLYDKLEQTLQPQTVAKMDREGLIERLERFQKQVGKTLKRQGVEMIDSTQAVQFDESFQEAIDTVSVETPQENERVVEVVRKGFRYRGLVLRPEQVIVGRFKPDKEAANE